MRQTQHKNRLPWLIGVTAVATSATWLISLQRAPWTTFSREAWISGIFLMIGALVLRRVKSAITLPPLAFPALFLAATSWAQWLVGKIGFVSLAWMPSLYLLGFAFCILIGAHCFASARKHLLTCLFFAFIIASMASTVGQIQQRFDIFPLLRNSDFAPPPTLQPHKAFGYLGQPNNLATLHLMAWVACLWICIKGVVSRHQASTLMLVCCCGLVLSGSRTGLLSLACVVLLLHVQPWFRTTGLRPIIWMSVILVVVLHLLLWLASSTQSNSLPQTTTASTLTMPSGDLRWPIWHLAISAIAENPLSGLGWGQVIHAQILAPTELSRPLQGTVTAHTHNLFLELALNAGIPIALVFFGWFGWQLCNGWKTIPPGAERLPWIALIPLAVHAQLELPLSYAYFLLPAGLLLGLGLSYSRCVSTPLIVPAKAVWGFWVLLFSMWAITVYDYLNIEKKLEIVRFENAHIGSSKGLDYPNTLLLTQLSGQVDFLRTKPMPGLSAAQLHTHEQLTLLYPTPHSILKLAAELYLNAQPERASQWLSKACRVVAASECEKIKSIWTQMQQTTPALKGLAWPAQQ